MSKQMRSESRLRSASGIQFVVAQSDRFVRARATHRNDSAACTDSATRSELILPCIPRQHSAQRRGHLASSHVSVASASTVKSPSAAFLLSDIPVINATSRQGASSLAASKPYNVGFIYSSGAEQSYPPIHHSTRVSDENVELETAELALAAILVIPKQHTNRSNSGFFFCTMQQSQPHFGSATAQFSLGDDECDRREQNR